MTFEPYRTRQGWQRPWDWLPTYAALHDAYHRCCFSNPGAFFKERYHVRSHALLGPVKRESFVRVCERFSNGNVLRPHSNLDFRIFQAAYRAILRPVRCDYIVNRLNDIAVERGIPVVYLQDEVRQIPPWSVLEAFGAAMKRGTLVIDGVVSFPYRGETMVMGVGRRAT